MVKTLIPIGLAILLARQRIKIHGPTWGLLVLRPPRSLIRITPRGVPEIFSRITRFPLVPDRMQEVDSFPVGDFSPPTHMSYDM